MASGSKTNLEYLSNIMKWIIWLGIIIVGIILVCSDGFGTFVLFLTAVFIGWQAWETKKTAKYLEYQTRSTAYFLLFKSFMYVKNTSNFLVKFYFRMSSNNQILDDDYWDDNKNGPLFIYPGAGYIGFPHAFDGTKLVTGKIKIEYRVVPSHINDAELNKDIQVVEWEYDKSTQKWRAPNGMDEKGILSFFKH